MAGHLVVLDQPDSEHFVHHYDSTIFVCVGSGWEQAGEGGNQCIHIREAVPLIQVFNKLLEIFDLFLAWERDLEASISRLNSFNAIIKSCDNMVDDPLALMDSQFRFVSYSKQLAHESGYEGRYVGDAEYLPLDTINQLTAMPDFNRLEDIRETFQYVCAESMIHKNIYSGGSYVGRLAIPCSGDVVKNAYYRQVLDILARYVEILYAKFGSFWHRKPSDTKFKQILCSLLSGNPPDQDVLHRALANRDWDPSDQYSLIQIKSHFTNNENKLGTALINHLENLWPGACCIPYQQKIIVLINMTRYEQSSNKLFTQELAYFLRDSLLLAGISRRFAGLLTVQAAYRQTDIAMDVGEMLDPMHWYFKFDQYAYWYLLRHGCQNFLPEQVCHPAINALREYDRKNNTELDSTLLAYIRQKYNAVSAARVLCVARSTFLKRLGRIQALTDIDLDDFQQRVYLALSYELLRQANTENEGHSTADEFGIRR